MWAKFTKLFHTQVVSANFTKLFHTQVVRAKLAKLFRRLVSWAKFTKVLHRFRGPLAMDGTGILVSTYCRPLLTVFLAFHVMSMSYTGFVGVPLSWMVRGYLLVPIARRYLPYFWLFM